MSDTLYDEAVTLAAVWLRANADERALLRYLRADQVRHDDPSFYCPLCSCRKSGDVDTPNGRDESCSDRGCVCHADLSAQLDPLDRRGDDRPLPFELGGDEVDWADGNEQF